MISGLLGAVLLAACGSALPPAPTEPGADPGFEEATPTPRPGLDEGEEEGPEALQPGDVVVVRVVGEREQELRPTPIDRWGFVHLPLMGSVKVGGGSAVEAEERLQKALGRVDRFARVSLETVEMRGRQVSVLGAVERPGVIPLVGDVRLAAALAAAGGARSAAVEDRLVALGDLDGLRLVRKGKALPIEPRLAIEGDPRHNVRVRPGDVIYVPPATAQRVMVMGDVNRPRSLAFRPGMRLTEALTEAGGLTRSADAADVRIVRGGYAAPRVFVASPRDLFAGKAPDVRLAPGDVVFVTEHWLATAGQVIERLVPTTATAVLVGAAIR